MTPPAPTEASATPLGAGQAVRSSWRHDPVTGVDALFTLAGEIWLIAEGRAPIAATAADRPKYPANVWRPMSAAEVAWLRSTGWAA